MKPIKRMQHFRVPIKPIKQIKRLSQLERTHGQQGQGNCYYPEPDDDLRLRPSFELKMMVQRGHPKNTAAAGHFKKTDLENDR